MIAIACNAVPIERCPPDPRLKQQRAEKWPEPDLRVPIGHDFGRRGEPQTGTRKRTPRGNE